MGAWCACWVQHLARRSLRLCARHLTTIAQSGVCTVLSHLGIWMDHWWINHALLAGWVHFTSERHMHA